MKIGIFGGSFNPPHNMHKKIALFLLDKGYVDKVIFVPTGTKYRYKNNLLPNNIRYEMVKIMTDKEPNMEVSSYELKNHLVSTYETLDHFKSIYPNDEIYFICGTDNLSYIDTWKRGEYILDNYHLLIIKRVTDDYHELLKRFNKYEKNIIMVDGLEMDDVSSTKIRSDIINNKDYLDEDVLKYITSNHLYEGKL